MNVNARLIKAFTQNPAEGNAAAVIFDEAALDNGRQRIARALDVPTTAFIAPAGADVGIRFFTPLIESPICLHALVAVSFVLYEADEIASDQRVRFHAPEDVYQVSRRSDGSINILLPAAQVAAPIADRTAIAAALGIPQSGLAPLPVQVASTGKPKLVVPIEGLETLLSVNPDTHRVLALCHEHAAQGIFPFTHSARDPSADYHARHFNPLALDEEDPICGIGTGALGAYLRHNELVDERDVVVEQGLSTGNPGFVHLHVAERIQIGGNAVQYGMSELSDEAEGVFRVVQ